MSGKSLSENEKRVVGIPLAGGGGVFLNVWGGEKMASTRHKKEFAMHIFLKKKKGEKVGPLARESLDYPLGGGDGLLLRQRR